MRNLELFTVSLLVSAVQADKFATCVFQDEATTDQIIGGRLMLRETTDGKLIVAGVLTGFVNASKHSIAVNSSPFDNSSCDSTGLPFEGASPFSPLDVTVPEEPAQCYGHIDSEATLDGPSSALGLGLSVYDSLVLANKLACCTVTEVPEATYNAILSMLSDAFGCQEPLEPFTPDEPFVDPVDPVDPVIDPVEPGESEEPIEPEEEEEEDPCEFDPSAEGCPPIPDQDGEEGDDEGEADNEESSSDNESSGSSDESSSSKSDKSSDSSSGSDSENKKAKKDKKNKKDKKDKKCKGKNSDCDETDSDEELSSNDESSSGSEKKEKRRHLGSAWIEETSLFAFLN